MNNQMITTGILMDETITISFPQVCHRYHIPEEVLIELLEHGLIKEITTPSRQVTFDSFMLSRIQSAWRLQEDLGVNLQGVILALELRDELETVRRELDILRRHMG